MDSPATLLRLALCYAADDSSLRTVAARAGVQGVAQLSDVALLNRLRAAAPWLGRLLTDLLADAVRLPEGAIRPLRLRLQDATTVSRPGSTGTDWRIHLGFDLQTLTMDQVEVTDSSGGETLQRVTVAPNEIWVGDRGYAHRAGIAHCAAAGGYVLVRLNWQNVPLQHPDGQPFDLLAALRTLPEATCGDFPVQLAPDAARQVPAVPGRLVAVRKSPQQAAEARRKLQQAARKKGKRPDPRTLEAAGYIFLFTTVPTAWLSATAALDLYRFRWQIELAFKRLKSLLSLDALTAKDTELTRAFLFGKLLLFALTERLCRLPEAAFSPWGYGPPHTPGPPAREPGLRPAALATYADGLRYTAPSHRSTAVPGAVAGPPTGANPPPTRAASPTSSPGEPRSGGTVSSFIAGECSLN